VRLAPANLHLRGFQNLGDADMVARLAK